MLMCHLLGPVLHITVNFRGGDGVRLLSSAGCLPTHSAGRRPSIWLARFFSDESCESCPGSGDRCGPEQS